MDFFFLKLGFTILIFFIIFSIFIPNGLKKQHKVKTPEWLKQKGYLFYQLFCTFYIQTDELLSDYRKFSEIDTTLGIWATIVILQDN